MTESAIDRLKAVTAHRALAEALEDSVITFSPNGTVLNIQVPASKLSLIGSHLEILNSNAEKAFGKEISLYVHDEYGNGWLLA